MNIIKKTFYTFINFLINFSYICLILMGVIIIINLIKAILK